MRKAQVRDTAIILSLAGALVLATAKPAQKIEPSKRSDLAQAVPTSVGPWRSETYDTKDFRDKWQSINELLVRRYFREVLASLRGPGHISVAFIAEYSSDLRQNFSFHFPENCHRAGGNEIQILAPLEMRLTDGRLFKAKRIFIRGRAGSTETIDKIVTYWLVIGGKPYWQTFFIKLDQMMSGLLSRAKEGYLVRVDYDQNFEYSPEGIEKAERVTRELIDDLYETLSPESREKLFGATQ